MSDTYTTELCGDKYKMEANFAEASSPIMLNGHSTQYQVADFGHSPKRAMRQLLEDDISASGDDLEDESVQSLIDDAVESME